MSTVITSREATSLSYRLRRAQSIRRRARLQSAASTAGWVAGSAGLFVVAVGGLFGLR
ncbi:MAG: hypothetical protein NVS9B1_20910 [Candidatus Dormibacteraceae bacterium]